MKNNTSKKTQDLLLLCFWNYFTKELSLFFIFYAKEPETKKNQCAFLTEMVS